VAAVPSSAVRAKRAVLFLRLAAGIAAGQLLINLWLPLVPGAFESFRTWEIVAFMSRVFNAPGLVIYPVTLLLYLLWLHRVVRQLTAWGLDVGATPGWAVGCWFVPLVNLFKPLRIVRSTLVVLGGPPLAASLHVQVWWGTFLLSRMLARTARFLSVGPGNTPLPPTRVAFVIGGAGFLCTIAAALLCARIVRSVQERLDARRDGLT
jgi:hypothetical protein